MQLPNFGPVFRWAFLATAAVSFLHWPLANVLPWLKPVVFFVDLLAIGFVLPLVAIAALTFAYAGLRAFSDRTDTSPFVIPLKQLVVLTLTAVLGTVAGWNLSNALPRALPSGSQLARFDRATWIAETPPPLGLTKRQQMLGDVMQTVLMKGRPRAEIEYDLGPSLVTPYFKGLAPSLIYKTGTERNATPFGIDDEWLLVWFDEHDQFLRADVLND